MQPLVYDEVAVLVHGQWTFLPCCPRCGALVAGGYYQDRHARWHEKLDETASKASYADTMTRPIG